MKTYPWCTVLILVLFLVVTPAGAQTLYDNFNGKLIDPSKWFGFETNSGSIVLEDGLKIKNEPLFGYRGVNMGLRQYGDDDSDTGQSTASKRLAFADGTVITTIIASVQIKSYQVTDCAANPATSETRARFGGAFFNAGSVAPAPENQLDDVFAFISVVRASNSAEPVKLSITGNIFRCLDATCSTNESLGQVDIGLVNVNKKVKLKISWDALNNRFIFRKGAGTEIFLPYTVTDAFAPATEFGGFKRLEIFQRAANCFSGPRTTTGMDVFFDDVLVGP